MNQVPRQIETRGKSQQDIRGRQSQHIHAGRSVSGESTLEEMLQNGSCRMYRLHWRKYSRIQDVKCTVYTGGNVVECMLQNIQFTLEEIQQNIGCRMYCLHWRKYSIIQAVECTVYTGRNIVEFRLQIVQFTLEEIQQNLG